MASSGLFSLLRAAADVRAARAELLDFLEGRSEEEEEEEEEEEGGGREEEEEEEEEELAMIPLSRLT